MALEPEWNELLNRSRSDNPFQTFEWYSSWLDVFSKGYKLLTLVARENGQLMGIAPLTVNSSGLASFIGYPLSDYADFIVAKERPGVAGALIEKLWSYRKQYTRIVLDQFPQDISRLTEIGDRLKSLGAPIRIESSDQCPAMVVNDVDAARKLNNKRKIKTN